MANISVLGRLTRDPQSRQTQSGSSVVSLDIAEDAGRKDQQGNSITTFYRASVWGKRGDTVMQYFHKGDPVYVYGDLVPRQYQAQDGTPRTSLDINNASFSFVPAPPKQQDPQESYQQQSNPQPQGGYQQPQTSQQSQKTREFNLNDLPFD